MPRAIIVGNGSLTVTLDNKLRIRDLFYPKVGLENHVQGHKCLLGVWVNNAFSWVGEDWEVTSNYLPETLVSKCTAVNPKLRIKMEVNDAVYSFQNIFLRKIIVKNASDSQREIRVFLSHDFHIYGEDTGDTALYEPTQDAIIHYKRNRYFLINGGTEEKSGFSGFATGQKEAFSREGTWRDAEDGVLSGNLIAQGSVDSAVSFKLDIESNSEKTLYYWIACDTNIARVKELNVLTKKLGVEQMLLETENYWSAWINRGFNELSILPDEVRRLFKTSLLVMRAHVDSNGGIVASCDSDVLQFNRDTYSYVWPRDAAICAMAFDANGFQEISRQFFEFCNRVITDEGYFQHKYWSDGSTGSSWHALLGTHEETQLPIQLDETALVLIALWNHFRKYHDVEFISKVYPRLVINATEFLLKYRSKTTDLPEPNFDVWEERAGVFTSTTSMVCLALSCAAKFAQVFYNSERQEFLNETVVKISKAMSTYLYDDKSKRLIKALYADNSKDLTIDSSLLMAAIYGIFNSRDEIMKKTVEDVVKRLWLNEGIGGVARYENDEYHRVSSQLVGNPWPICTLWLARWYSRTAESIGELNKSLDLLLWCGKTASSSGLFAEQLNPYDGTPLSVSPLMWSHAEFVLAVTEYIQHYERLSVREGGGEKAGYL